MLHPHGYSRTQHPRILLVLLTVILCRQLQERLATYKITVSRPDTQTCVSSVTYAYVSQTQTTLLFLFSIAPKLWPTAPSASTVITTCLHACQSSCMVSSFLESSTPTTLIMNGGRKNFVNSLQVPSFYRMLLIVF